MTAEPINNDTLGSLELALSEAVNRLSAATHAKDQAWKAETEARNRVNELQKKIDARILQMKGSAEMRGTDWGRQAGEAP